ncbi:MAG: carboxypeptidase-like regulatory domain-containing protein, partial [Bacteroidota bacterium]
MFIRLLFISICFSALSTQAQVWVKGQIQDRGGRALIGANVFIEGTYDGAFSDSLGQFTFQTAPREEAVLTVRLLSYRPYQQVLDLKGDTIRTTVKLQSTTRAVDEVVITAGAFEASDEKKGVVLRSLDIVTTAGSNGDINAAINTLPGTTAVGEEGQLFVRGGAAYETQTFIDGLRVGRPYGARIPDLPARGRFSPFLFKGTLFSSGGYSAAYGQALSAAMILETQDLPESSQSSFSLMSVGASAGH